MIGRQDERRGEGVWLLIFLVLLLVGAKPAADAAMPLSPGGPAGAAAKLPPERIYRYARRASFTPDEAVTATAVALAESAGRPRAHNPTPPDDSYCLMQVNMLGRLGPARRARFHLAHNEDLYDPATCMRVSYGISAGGSDWTPWTTYTRGTYLRFLAAARRAQGGR